MADSRYIMYLAGQHHAIPERSLVSQITHVALAFINSAAFNRTEPDSWPLFTTVDAVRSKFSAGTAVMVAIGGWGDTEGFDVAARTDDSRKLFAQNIRKMVAATGADGVDIDWEYPGGNGEDYKNNPNPQKAWEIEAYPLLLAEIRACLGPHKIISAAVPGLERDMIAFTNTTIPAISASLDFFNVMTYDLMNRRDATTKHHTGIKASLSSVKAYEDRRVPLAKMNLGFAFYVRWFKTDPNGGCHENPVGCKTVLMEDPVTGDDLGLAGAISWCDPVPEQLSGSYERAMTQGKYDSEGGGHYYWDLKENIWWTWDTPNNIAKKFPAIVGEKGLGGAFAWELGGDGNDFVHLKALNEAMKGHAGNHY